MHNRFHPRHYWMDWLKNDDDYDNIRWDQTKNYCWGSIIFKKVVIILTSHPCPPRGNK